MNNTYCLDCGTISKGSICNNCGESNIVPAHDYKEDGFLCCPKCGAAFKYRVGTCSICQKGE